MEYTAEHVRLLEATAHNNFAWAINLQERLWAVHDDMKAIHRITHEALDTEAIGFVDGMYRALKKIEEISGRNP